MAKLMHFYHGLTVTDYENLSHRRRATMVEVMENSLAARQGGSNG